MVYGVIKAIPKSNMCDGRWKFIHRIIEVITKVK
jgi:hypothetical protein